MKGSENMDNDRHEIKAEEQVYSNNNKNKRGKFSYILAGIIGGIIGGILSTYIAPNYLYGKIIPMPEIFQNTGSVENLQRINIRPRDDLNTVALVAEKSMSSVVGITTVVIERNWIWERPTEGVGSGIIVDSRGFILTNSHVIGDGRAESINVLFEDGDQREGRVLWFDRALDLAIIKVDDKILNEAHLGDSDDLIVGELAIAIGNPLGLDFQRSVTSGVVSGLNRSIRIDEFMMIENLIQTDASINPGNSGGPLLNARGEVVGINTAKIKNGEGLGFSIPINTVKPIIEQVIESGQFNNVYIGFQGIEVQVYQRQIGIELNLDSGVIVLEVVPNSPAYNAGIRNLDIIQEIDGQVINSMISLRRKLYNYKLGDRASLKISRDGQEMYVEIEFTEIN